MSICKIEGCNCECYKGRAYCHKHFLEKKREQYREKKEKGLKVRTLYDCICSNCHKPYKGFKKDSLFCSQKCFREFNKTHSFGANNNYEYNKNYKEGLNVHRVIAEKLLGRKLTYNEVVHHLDGNSKNNELSNLIILSRSKHTQLHQFLLKQGALLEQSNNGNNENCWNNLIAPMTTTWLETANVKVKKLSEIGQSAAKPLLNVEGSETMHVASHVDEDIVQTTTLL